MLEKQGDDGGRKRAMILLARIQASWAEPASLRRLSRRLAFSAPRSLRALKMLAK